MFGCAFGDDDLAHLAVVQHVVQLVILGQQRLQAEVEFGIDLDRLRRGFFVRQNAQIGVKAQAGQLKGLMTLGVEHGDSLSK